MRVFLFCLFFLCEFSFAIVVSNDIADTTKVVNIIGSRNSEVLVTRGCRTKWIKLDTLLDENTSQDSLLSVLYGNVPSPDSLALYDAWADSCHTYVSKKSREGYETIAYGVGVTALGIFLTFFVDYNHLWTAILGRTFGIGTLATLTPLSFILASQSFYQSPKEIERGKKLEKRYRENADRFRLRIAPSIDLREPGGGVFMQLGF